MVDFSVAVAIRVAIHFGKWVTSFVSLVFVLIENQAGHENDPYLDMERNANLGRKLVRMYMLFWKLRRRAMRIMREAYPDVRGTNAFIKNVALGRLFMRMEEVSGKLDAALYDNPSKLINLDFEGDILTPYATSRWHGRPCPPPMLELDYFGHAFNRAKEEALSLSRPE